MTTQLLSFGTQITSSTDELQPVSIQQLFELLTMDALLQSNTTRLRKLVQFDKEAFRSLKTRLPYVVGSQFGGASGAIRRMEHFQAAHYFVLDVDHCPGLGGKVPDVVRATETVELAFVSPSGEGIKLFYRLAHPCTDARLFSVAYRNFATQMGEQFNWASGIDLRTSDVTRACFLAHDLSAHYNPDARSIDWQVWLTDAEAELFADEPKPSATGVRKPITDRPINDTAYRDVLRQINGREPVRRQKQAFVPDMVRELEPEVQAICLQMNWELKAIEPLNYGLKFIVRQGLRQAEINAFCGKKGFSLVRSPKSGTDPALSEMLYSKLFSLLFPEPIAENVLLKTIVSAN